MSTRLDNLSVAREMEAEKKDAKAVKMATGWERGADGKEQTYEDGMFEQMVESGVLKRAQKTEEPSEAKVDLTDNQGNPVNDDGTLKVEAVQSVDELTDEDFSAPTRNVQLPALPQNVDAALNANGKPVIIKKNIFKKNWGAHKFYSDESRAILKAALYNTDLVGQRQSNDKPLHWVAIRIDDESPTVVLEVNENKDNIEIVDWFTVDERESKRIYRIKKQAEKNGGELVMLSPMDKVESLSTPQTDLSSESKGTEQSSSVQVDVSENAPMPMRVVGKGKNAAQEEDWLATTPKRGHDYVFKESGLDAEEANAFVENKVAEAEKNLEKVKGKAPKMGTNIAAYKEAKADYEARVAEAQKAVDYWHAVKAERDKVLLEERRARKEKDKALYDDAVAQEEQRKAEMAQKAAEQEALGSNAVAPAIKEKWENAPKVDGGADEITLPNGEVVTGHYVLTESGAASASHQATNGFAETEGYPVDVNGETVNDRDYKRDAEAQQVTRGMAADYDSRALQSPVVVSGDGVVLSGNGRTMAGEIAALNGSDAKYNAYLRGHAGKFGFTTEQVEGFEHPRVVFVPDGEMPYTSETFAKFNQREQKSQSRTEMAVKLGKVVDDALFGRVMDVIGRHESLAEFYADDAATAPVVKELADAGVIPQTEMAQLFDGGRLSESGQAMVEGVLVGKVFQGSPDAVRQITEVKSMRKAVMAALPEVVACHRLGGGYDLSKELAAAVDLVYKARKAGFKLGQHVSQHARQGNLFQLDDGATVADYNNAAVMMLADVMNDGRVTQLKKVLSFYNTQAADSAQGIGDMFAGGVKSKGQIINEVNELLNNGQEYDRRTPSVADGQGVGGEGGEQGDVAGPSHQGGAGSERGLSEAFDGLAAQLKTAEGDERKHVLGEMRDGIARFAEENGYPVPEFLLTREDFLAAVPEKDRAKYVEMLEKGMRMPAYYENKKVYYFVEGCDNFDKDVAETLAHEYTHADNAEFPENVNAIVYAVEDTHEVSQDELVDILEKLSDSTVYEEKAEQLEAEGKNANPMLADEVIAHSVGRMVVEGEQALDGITKNPTLQFFIKRAYKERENERQHNLYSNRNAERADKTVPSSGRNSSDNEAVAGGTPGDGQLGGSSEGDGHLEGTAERGRSTVSEGKEVAAPSEDGAKVGVTDGEKSSATGDVMPSGKGNTPLSEKIATASAEVNTEPTEAQKEAGNYKKGHVQVGTFDITIEQPQGSVRKGTDADGKQWESKMNNTYGYIRGAVGVDGDHIDVFLSNDIDGWNGRRVFVVDQYNPDGSFDEHKVMLGFNDADEAKSDYLANYENGWENGRRIDVTAVNLEDFEKWIASSKRKTKPFGDYSSVKNGVVGNNAPVNEDTPSEIQTLLRERECTPISQEHRNLTDEGVVADNAGNPITLYHGTLDKSISVSELEAGHKRADGESADFAGSGVYFTPNKDVAEEYGYNGQVFEAHIKLSKPFYMLGNPGFNESEAVQFSNLLKSKGYDGIINYMNAWSVEHNMIDGGQVVVFNNSSILPIEKGQNNHAAYSITPSTYTNKKGESVERNEVLEYEKALDHLEDVEQKWGNKIQDYVFEHYPTQATTSAESTSEKGLQERKAMKADPVLKQMYAEAKKEIDAADEMVTQKYSALPEDLRQQKAVGKSAQPPTREESILRDVVIEHMKGSGLDVIGTEDGQRVLDMVNGRDVRLEAKQKRALETATIAEQSTNNATVVSSADGAKVQKVLETLADNYEKRPNKTRGFITDLSRSLGLVQHEASQYGTFETRNGKLVTIRVSNHNARVSFFDENGEEDGISIVISSHKNKGVLNDGKAHLVEYFYPKQSLERSGGKPLADIVKCVSTVLESGKFEDTTGLAQRQEVNAQQIREHRVYHGSGAEFDHFDHSHMSEGEGSQVYGWGTYVTEVKGIAEGYAIRARNGISNINEEWYLKRGELESNIYRAKEQLPFLKGEYKAEMEAQISEWEKQLKEYDGPNNLYTVEIPDDNGSNYLAWNEPLSVEDSGRIISGLFDLPPSDIEEMAKRDYTFKHILYDLIKINDKAQYVPVLAKGNVLSRSTMYDGGREINDFGGVYRRLQGWFGSAKAVSKFLYSLGYAGIKYPADYRSGGREDDAKNYVIFNENDAEITDHVRFFKTKNGEAYGFTVGGKIYYDPRIANAETPVHEYAHLWASALKANNAEEWKNVVDLMKGTNVWEEVKKTYPELETDDEIADEVLATYSGRRGAERLREEMRKAAAEGDGVMGKAEAVSALQRVKRAIDKFWKAVADFLHIHYTSAEEVADRVMKDLLDGVDPRSMMDGGKSLRPETRINIVETKSEHGFKNYAEAKAWAKEHIARTYSGEETGGKGDIRISNAAVDKYLSQSAVDKSESKDVHLAVLKVLPDVIRESVDAEQHADFKKGEDGVRSAANGVNPNVTIHRLYGAVRMDGKLYRVKVTLKENTRTKDTPKAYSYEATKIELLEGSLSQTEGSHNLEPSNSKSEVSAGQHGNVSGLTSTFPRYSDKSITAANLLNGVEKSYDGGKFFEDYNKIREQFIGEKGAAAADHADEVNTRLDNLSVAREMEAEKKDAKAIKMATGWERGADGKWRYEIADMKEFDRNGNLLYRKNHPDYARYIELLDKEDANLFEGGEALTVEERAEFETLSKKYESEKFGGEKLDNNHTLEAYVDAPELFKAYPELKNVGLRFENTGGNEIASYRYISSVFDVDKDDVGEIVVNTGKVSKNTRTREVKSAVLHEMQHAIQEIEGFAGGGSPKSMQKRFEAAKEEWRARAWADALRYKADEMGEHYNQAAVEKALIDEYKEMGMDNDEWMPDRETRMKGFNYFARGYADRSMDSDIKNFRLNESTRADFSPYVEYTRLGGEVESRNVERRMGMSAEERRASLAAETEDVSREDQIFLTSGDGGNANSEMLQETGTENDYSEFAKEHGVDADMVKDYALGIKTGNLQKANFALTEIRRTMRVANRGMKLSEFGKLFRPVQKELAERYGDIEVLRQEYIDAEMRERGVMEAARKRAEEEAAKRKARADELRLLPEEELDRRYFEAVERGDDAAAREMLDEAARRKGYGDTESEYQGVGAWVAPSNPGYESDAVRRADVEDNAPDVNVEDIALGYSLVDENYWHEPRKYMQTDATAVESVNAINDAMAAIRRGEKDVKVKVYRAVPTSVKEGKLRNGDWVTPSRAYAKMHGEHRLEGDYRIIEDEVPVNELWWDGNDSREWGFDDGKGYKYKNVENSRKLNDLVTRDDNGEIIAPSKRFDENVEDVRYRTSEELGQINQKFNERLDELVSNPNQKDKVLHLGRSSEFLKDGGISDAEIVLDYDKLVRKSSENYSNHHPYSAEDIHDLPIAVHNPIALFENTNGKGGFVILTELKKDGRNFIAALRTTEQNRKGGVLLTVNEITTLYPKEVRGIIHWINQGKITNVDKEKALHFIEALQPHAGTTITNEELLSAANVVKDFETLQLSASEKAKHQAANDLARQMHVEGEVEVVTSTDGLTGRQAKAKGWYDVRTGRVTIVLPNNKNAADVRETVFHEVVAHKGLRNLVGEEHFNTFLDNVYNNAEEGIKQTIDEMAEKKYNGDKRKATEEYMAHLAEDGEYVKPENQGFFAKVRDFLTDLLRKVGIKLGFKLTDNDLRYILWRSWKGLAERDGGSVFEKAEDVKMQHELGQTDEARSASGENGIMFREGSDELKDVVEKMKADVERLHEGELDDLRSGARAIGGRLSELNKAMRLQRAYDMSTVASVTELAKTMLKNGLLSEMSDYDVRRLLSVVNNVHGKGDIRPYVQKVVDMMVGNRLRNVSKAFDKLLAMRGKKVDARGVEVQGELDLAGQRMADVVWKGIGMSDDDVADMCADAQDRMMSANGAEAAAATDYAGWQIVMHLGLLPYYNNLLAEYLASYTNTLQLIDCQYFTQCKILQISLAHNLHTPHAATRYKHGRRILRYRGAEKFVAPTKYSTSLWRMIHRIRQNRLRGSGV